MSKFDRQFTFALVLSLTLAASFSMAYADRVRVQIERSCSGLTSAAAISGGPVDSDTTESIYACDEELWTASVVTLERGRRYRMTFTKPRGCQTKLKSRNFYPGQSFSRSCYVNGNYVRFWVYPLP